VTLDFLAHIIKLRNPHKKPV